eukprot:g2179.t1
MPTCDLQPCKLGSFLGPEPTCSGVQALLKEARDKHVVPILSNGSAILIVPHASLRYSGPFAAAGYEALRHNKFDRVVVVGFYHHLTSSKGFEGIVVGDCANYYHGGFDATGAMRLRQLLGPSARSSCEAGSTPVYGSAAGCVGEHSLEEQLPFVQTLFVKNNQPMVIPVMMGSASPALTDTLATALDAFRQSIAGTDRPRVLFVFSSDLSHHFPEAAARGLDRQTLGLIARGDALELEGYFASLAAKDQQATESTSSSGSGGSSSSGGGGGGGGDNGGGVIIPGPFRRRRLLQRTLGEPKVVDSLSSSSSSSSSSAAAAAAAAAQERQSFPCGHGPIVAAAKLAQLGEEFHTPGGVVVQGSSGVRSREFTSVVGYGVVVFTTGVVPPQVPGALDFTPTEEEQQAERDQRKRRPLLVDRFDQKSVLDAARYAVQEAVCTNVMDTGPDRSAAYGGLKETALGQITAQLGDAHRGVFVTIMRNSAPGMSSLRGCVGCVTPGSCFDKQEDSYTAARQSDDTVPGSPSSSYVGSPVSDTQTFRSLLPKAASLAATSDSRFAPIGKSELASCSVEVSVLSTPRPATYDEIRQGDGVVFVAASGSRGVYLPDVWDSFSDPDDAVARLRAKKMDPNPEAVAALVKHDFMVSLATEKAHERAAALHAKGARFQIFSSTQIIDTRPIGRCDD